MATGELARPTWIVRLASGRGIYYGWLVVAITLLAMCVTSGVRMASGVLIQPFEAEFGWDRASVSLAFSVGLLANGLGGPFAGRLMDRFGPRRVLLGSVILTVIGSVGTVFMTSLVQLTLWWGLVVGIGSGGLAGSMGPVVANRWFVEKRGLVTGVLGGAASAGQLVFIPTLMAVTVAVDWRAALGLMVALLVLVLPLALFLMRDDPAEVGLKPYGTAANARPIGGLLTPMAQAIMTADFWLLSGSFFVCGFTTGGLIGTHFIPHAVE